MDQLLYSYEIIDRLLSWYQENKRDLPWRRTRDPYSIWISEIILQQTRVEQGKGYYLRFVQRFPDVKSLAQASEQEVLKLWQGLGYYTRARHLHQTARLIVEKYPGAFPGTYESLIALPGIGEYTAAAILSIAFDEPYPVVDGNVIRVISRLMGITAPVDTVAGRSQITSAARQLIPDTDPGTFNQAIMEFGALYCKPVSPDCQQCPLQMYCKAFQMKRVDELPVRRPKSIPAMRYFHYLVIGTSEQPSQLILRKRTARDIWRNLYDFPLVEADRLLISSELASHPEINQLFKDSVPELFQQESTYRHVLSHQLLYVRFFYIDNINKEAVNLPENCFWIGTDILSGYPVPRLIAKFLER